MFQKVLIANRGEIAVRIIQACRDLGIISVAVYSEADREALHAQIADEAVCIGPARAAESYLNMDNIISAALASGCQADSSRLRFSIRKSRFCRADYAGRPCVYRPDCCDHPSDGRQVGGQAQCHRGRCSGRARHGRPSARL